MRAMARMGRGICAFVYDTTSAENGIETFFRKLRRPVMTDLEVEGLDPDRTYPSTLPDLHAGEPLALSFLLPDGAPDGTITLAGRTHWGWFHRELEVRPLEAGAGRDQGLTTRWARARVTDLMDSLHQGADSDAVRDEVVALGKSHHLVTRYTSLVAVEEVPSAEDEAGSTLRNAARLGPGALPRGGTFDPLKKILGGLLSLLGGLVLIPFLVGRPR
jgi:Ca-activated chloride channel family protein